MNLWCGSAIEHGMFGPGREHAFSPRFRSVFTATDPAQSSNSFPDLDILSLF